MNLFDRMLVCVAEILVIEWQKADERAMFLGVLREALEGKPKDPDLAPLVEAGHAMLTAEGPVEWERATRQASRALAASRRTHLLKLIDAMRKEGAGCQG